MSKSDENGKKTLTLSHKANPQGQTASVRQNLSQGRSKNVEVEVKRRRLVKPGDRKSSSESAPPQGLTQEEWELRLRVVRAAKERAAEDQQLQEAEAQRRTEREQKILEEKAQREELEHARLEKEKEEAQTESTPEPIPVIPGEPVVEKPTKKAEKSNSFAEIFVRRMQESAETDADEARGPLAPKTKKSVEDRRRNHRLTIQDALLAEETDDGGPKRSDASIRRARAKEKAKAKQQQIEVKKVIREVIIPETITVQDLANRMATRTVDVVKSLMKMGMMVTPQQIIDADTAELVVSEFGHDVKRVAASDIEEGLQGTEDHIEDLIPRAPVVTIMGHVDHGKTSLLDALRKTDVAAHEAGGITQHIGAYQVKIATGERITFIDTPGHAAFTEMRARGAKLTDIVVLVVAADDGIKEQTIEAINHIKAAEVPMIIAINKIDKPGADVDRVKSELLQHSIVTEDFGGEVLCVPVSAKQNLNLDKLEEAILLQSEMLNLRANPNREAHGIVIESKMEKGRGSVATILIQKGTLRVGDNFIVGNEWGKVRALMNDRGETIKEAIPSLPVAVLGLNGSPEAGDKLIVVESDSKAREISEYRQHKSKALKMAKAKTAAFENMFAATNKDSKDFVVVIKGDTHGSIEALQSSFKKLETDEVKVRILHTGVGSITESDVILAQASNGCIMGFNVRANPQAREMAEKSQVPINYYSIIYDAIDEVKAQLSGLLAPERREKYLGKAEIRQVFNVTKVGKIAGCMITEGTVQRGARVRLLRDNMVIHEGALKTLKRFKDEVKEVKEGYECGMAFEAYQDVREGDIIECFIVEEFARMLD